MSLVIFNSFVWMYLKQRLRAIVLQQKQKNGDLALPNIEYYYLAAMLEHFSHWTNFSNRRVWELEQRGIAVPLSEWILGGCHSIKTSHWITKTMVSFWKKHGEKVLMGLSPLASFLLHPMFQEAVKLHDFNNWKSPGYTHFFKLGKGREMHSVQVLAQQIGDSSGLEYQLLLFYYLISFYPTQFVSALGGL